MQACVRVPDVACVCMQMYAGLCTLQCAVCMCVQASCSTSACVQGCVQARCSASAWCACMGVCAYLCVHASVCRRLSQASACVGMYTRTDTLLSRNPNQMFKVCAGVPWPASACALSACKHCEQSFELSSQASPVPAFWHAVYITSAESSCRVSGAHVACAKFGQNMFSAVCGASLSSSHRQSFGMLHVDKNF